jgi:high-affinity iron transporter
MRTHGRVVWSAGTVGLGVGLLALLTLPLPLQQSLAAQGTASDGQGVFKKYCAVCHGESGAGDGPAAAKMKQKPRNLGDKAIMAKISDEQILKAINEGIKTEGAAMPPFAKKLSDADKKAVVSYVRSLTK